MLLLSVAIAVLGCLVVIASYVFMAETRGVLRYFAYDRLLPSGKKVWIVGWAMILIGCLLVCIFVSETA